MTHRPLFRAFFLSAILVSGVAGAAAKPIKALPSISGVPDDSVKVASRVQKLLPSTTSDKARVSAKAFASRALEGMTEAAVAEAARADAAKLVDAKNSDVSALAFIILMEASKAAEEDLKAVMASVKKINAEREKLREAMGKLKGTKKASAPAYLKKITAAKTPNLQIAYSTLPEVSASTCETKDLEACADELRQKEEALGDLSEGMAARLQMYMDRRQKALSAASNLLKKVSDTQDQIISNMK